MEDDFVRWVAQEGGPRRHRFQNAALVLDAKVVGDTRDSRHSLDGLQPEQGTEQLWVVREVWSGSVLAAANLQQPSAPMLVPLLQPIRTAGLSVLGVVSDAQE